MVSRSVRLVVHVALVVVLASGTAGWLFSWATPTEPWCRISGDWAKTVSAKDLPQTLSQFREVPKSYRQALWGLLPPEAKSQIMRETFQAASATTTLTAEQEIFLRECIETASPAFYAENARLNKAEADRAKALGITTFREDALAQKEAADGATALKIFTRAQYVKLLSPFRLSQTLPQQTTLLLPTLRSLIMGMTAKVGAVVPTCGCSHVPPDCQTDMCLEWRAQQGADCLNHGGNESSCENQNTSCNLPWDGCGFYGNVQCNRRCTGTDPE